MPDPPSLLVTTPRPAGLQGMDPRGYPCVLLELVRLGPGELGAKAWAVELAEIEAALSRHSGRSDRI